MFTFFKNLHINLNVAIEKRENFDTTISRETIFVQNIDFFDVAIDKNFDEISKKNMFFERSRTISDTNIEKNMNFDEMKNDEMINRNNETKNEKIIDRNDVKNFDSKTNETTNSTNC